MRTTPTVPVGATYPVTQWELTFADFQQLLASPDSRAQIAPLLRSWFGYSISGGSSAGIAGPTGDPIDPLSVHIKIQDDSGKQFALYQLAMSLWR